MKKLIATTLACTALGLAAYAQGTVTFANVGGGVNAPVFLSDGTTKASGSQYMAALLAGPSATSLAQIATTPFLSGAQAGYFLGGTQTIPTVAGGSTAMVLIEVWNTTAGADFATAKASGSPNSWGWSAGGTPFSVTTGNPNATPPGLPAALSPLTSFNLVGVPEPSTFALAGLGAAAMLIFRRRK